jgi:cytosine/adenosine deaminase-related metal-dependent hydrolase
VIGAGDQGGYLATQCPTRVRENWRSDAGGDDHYDWMRRELGGFVLTPASQKHFANLRQMREMGARFVAGTDAGAGITRFQDLWLCLGVFVASLRFSVVEAIQTATQLAAQALNVDRELGTLEVGKLADVILVEGNPATDGIECLQRVALVFKRGRTVAADGALVDPAGLAPGELSPSALRR